MTGTRSNAMTPILLAQLQFACKSLTELAANVREETNEVVATNDHVKVIKHYDALRHLSALVKETKDALAKIEERLSREQVPDVMRLANIRSTTIEGVGRVSL